jgi:arylsulfatase A
MMNKRNFLKTLAMVSLLAPMPQLLAAESDDGRKPNFVVILIDDMGYADIQPFGSKRCRTPHLNRMAEEGMKLTSFYAAPVCTPSRAQILTGCYAKRVSLPSVVYAISDIGLNPKEKTVATLLKEQGYATMCIGKWHLGDQPEFLPTKHGFDHHFGLPYSNDMKKIPLPLLRDGKVIEAPAVQETLTARYTEEAVEFIKSKRKGPFFLYLPHTAVHGPMKPGKSFEGKSGFSIYMDWVEEVDWSVGRILDTLREQGLTSNTMVLFTSDNGPWMSLTKKGHGGYAEPLRGGKFNTWEGGMRVPTLVWWPGKIEAGSVSDGIVSELDVLPTLVGLAGGKVPGDRKIDGVDVWPLLSGKTKESPRKELFYFNGPTLQGVRSGKWKLRQEKDVGWQLFDLEADIGESTDVAAANAEVVKRLQGLIDEMGKDLGVQENGPGVREAGRVAEPKGLFLSEKEYD